MSTRSTRSRTSSARHESIEHESTEHGTLFDPLLHGLHGRRIEPDERDVLPALIGRHQAIAGFAIPVVVGIVTGELVDEEARRRVAGHDERGALGPPVALEPADA